MRSGGIGELLVCLFTHPDVSVTNENIAQNFPKARERLEDLKKGGKNGALKGRERISRSKVGKAQEGECAVM